MSECPIDPTRTWATCPQVIQLNCSRVELGLCPGQPKPEEKGGTYQVEPRCYGDYKDGIRPVIRLFTAEHLYTKAQQRLSEDKEYLGGRKIWSIYLGWQERNYPPIVVLDTDGYVNVKNLEMALVSEDDSKTLAEYVKDLPERERGRLLGVLKSWGINKDNVDISTQLTEARIAFRPVPRLKDVSILTTIDWHELVESIVAWKCKKDERLKLIHKSHLLRGAEQRLNPHSLQFTNSGPGKTEYYDKAGYRFDKVTPRSFLGFARNPEEVYPGVIDQTELPIGIDQIESQGAQQILSYLFSAMVQGEGKVSSGSVSFTVKTSSTFNILGNPVGYASDTTKSFGSLIEHMSFNPAIGSRFGLIVYGKDFQPIERESRTLEGWEDAFRLFRAVEEFALPSLREIREHAKVWEWLKQEIAQYFETVQSIVEGVENETVHDFLTEHAKGAQQRIRNAALNVALAEDLKEIALKECELDELLAEADDHLSRLVDINIQSIINIAKAYEQEIEAYASTFFRNLPDYMTQIVSAIELYRRLKPESPTVLLRQIPYEPPIGYFSKAIEKLLRRKNLEDINAKLVRYFGFQLKRLEGDVEIFYTKLDACDYITPVGRLLSDLSNFPVSPISPFPRHSRDTSSSVLELNSNRLEQEPVYESGEKGKTGKWGKAGPSFEEARGSEGVCELCNQSGGRWWAFGIVADKRLLICDSCKSSFGREGGASSPEKTVLEHGSQSDVA